MARCHLFVSGEWEVRSQNVKFKTVFFFLKKEKSVAEENILSPQPALASVGSAPEKVINARTCLRSGAWLLPWSVVNSCSLPGQGTVLGALCRSAAVMSPAEGQQWMPTSHASE